MASKLYDENKMKSFLSTLSLDEIKYGYLNLKLVEVQPSKFFKTYTFKYEVIPTSDEYIILWETLNVFVQAVITYETVTAQIAHQEANLLEEKRGDVSGELAQTYSNEYEDTLKEHPFYSTLPIGRSTKLLKNADTFKDLMKKKHDDPELFSSDTEKVQKFNKIVRGLTRKQQFDPQHQLNLYGSETAPVYEGPRKGGRKSRRSKRKRTRRK